MNRTHNKIEFLFAAQADTDGVPPDDEIKRRCDEHAREAVAAKWHSQEYLGIVDQDGKRFHKVGVTLVFHDEGGSADSLL